MQHTDALVRSMPLSEVAPAEWRVTMVQVRFPEPGAGALAALQPEEEQPFRLLLQQIRACLHASPARRATAESVARTLHAEAHRLQWL